MELKQLEYFVTASECKSFGKAARKLYTSQPNVSKVIKSLEQELGRELFVRNAKGISLSPYGRTIYDIASDMLRKANYIKKTGHTIHENILYLSSYRSNLIAQLLVNLYNEEEDLWIEYRQGTMEEVVNHVSAGLSEIGILYIAEQKQKEFLRILSERRLDFIPLAQKNSCIFAGEHSGCYDRQTISIDEMYQYQYLSGLMDYFTIDDGPTQADMGIIDSNSLVQTVRTNSEHLVMNMLNQTDVLVLGIDITYPGASQKHKLKNISIEGNEHKLILGYVKEEGKELSGNAQKLLSMFQAHI